MGADEELSSAAKNSMLHEQLSRDILGAAMGVLNLALLLNFKEVSLTWRRVVHEPHRRETAAEGILSSAPSVTV
jgi:hypothetical protein